MDFPPERLPEITKKKPVWKYFFLFLILLAFGLPVGIYIERNFLPRDLSAEGLKFSHGLFVGMEYMGIDKLKEDLKEKGFKLLREIEPGSYEFTDAKDSLLLRVKGKEEFGLTAIYLYIPPSYYDDFQRFYGKKDLLGYKSSEIKRKFGPPVRKERHKREVFKKGEPIVQSWAYETWYYFGKGFSLTTSFNKDGIAIEVVVQLPIAN